MLSIVGKSIKFRNSDDLFSNRAQDCELRGESRWLLSAMNSYLPLNSRGFRCTIGAGRREWLRRFANVVIIDAARVRRPLAGDSQWSRGPRSGGFFVTRRGGGESSGAVRHGEHDFIVKGTKAERPVDSEPLDYWRRKILLACRIDGTMNSTFQTKKCKHFSTEFF